MWDKGGRRGEEREQFSVHDPSLKPGFYSTHSLRGVWLLMTPTRKRVLMAPSYCTVTMCLVRAGCVTPRRADIKLNNGLWGLHHVADGETGARANSPTVQEPGGGAGTEPKPVYTSHSKCAVCSKRQ